MAKSISQIQQQNINNGRIDAIAKDMISDGMAGSVTDLPLVEATILSFAVAFIEKVKENLENAGKVDTGKLISQMDKGELTYKGGVYSLDIGYDVNTEMAKYYDFVNKGVQGTDSGQPNSPYKFRTRTPSINGLMVVAIQKWIKRQGIAARRETTRTTVTATQRKRKAVSELNTGRTTAFLIARKIKRRGLSRTGFMDDAIDDYFGKQFEQVLSLAVAANIEAVIRATSLLINKENK